MSEVLPSNYKPSNSRYNTYCSLCTNNTMNIWPTNNIIM